MQRKNKALLLATLGLFLSGNALASDTSVTVNCVYNSAPPSGISVDDLKTNMTNAIEAYPLPLYHKAGEEVNGNGNPKMVTVESVGWLGNFSTTSSEFIELDVKRFKMKLESDYYDNVLTSMSDGIEGFSFELQLNRAGYNLKDIYDLQDSTNNSTGTNVKSWRPFTFQATEATGETENTLGVLYASTDSEGGGYGFVYFSNVNGQAVVAGLCGTNDN